MIKIKHRVTGEVLQTVDAGSLEGAVLRGADLRGAVLQGADLRYADLEGAVLRYAELEGADLRGAVLRGADLGGADLRDADLRHANLEGANLEGADLEGADLRGADLRGVMLPNTDAVVICPWSVCHIQRERIRIGCEHHKTSKWVAFTDKEIEGMDTRALEWWKRNKEIVLFIATKCEPYGGE